MLKYKRALLSLFIIGFLLLACSSNEIFHRGALFETLLRVYPSHPNMLVNQRCAKFDKGKCIELDHQVFNLKKPEDKKQLVDLKFICNVAGERFGVCHNYAGLCKIGPYGPRPCPIFCSRPVVILKYLDIEKDFKYILNSNTICAAQDSFMGQRLFYK